MKKVVLFSLTLLLLCGLTNVANARLIGLSSDSNSLYEIDPLTGAASFLVGVTGYVSLTGISFLDGTLYATDIFETNLRTGTIDLTTGVYTGISDQDGSINWHGLASDEDAGLFYSIDIDDGNKLKSLTPAGVVTTIGTGAGIAGSGMAYDDFNNILYGTGGTSLYTVDTTLGTSSLVGNMGIGSGRLGLAYDEDFDILFANTDGSLYTLDVTSGVSTLIGANGFDRIDGLAWIGSTSIPEPGTILLLGTGLLSLGVIGRKKYFNK